MVKSMSVMLSPTVRQGIKNKKYVISHIVLAQRLPGEVLSSSSIGTPRLCFAGRSSVERLSGIVVIYPPEHERCRRVENLSPAGFDAQLYRAIEQGDRLTAFVDEISKTHPELPNVQRGSVYVEIRVRDKGRNGKVLAHIVFVMCQDCGAEIITSKFQN